MKTGTVLLAELAGPVAERIHEIQREFDPRMAAELPPHVTLTGSSGVGPLPAAITAEEIRAALEPIARETPPIEVRFNPPHKFMQSLVVVLTIDPYGPIRVLHERIKASGLKFEPPRFAFTPHCTLSFYPELSKAKLRNLLAMRIDEPVTIDRIAAFKAVTITRTENILELPPHRHMNDTTDILAAIEADCEPGAAAILVRIATDYLAKSRDRSTPVSSLQDQPAAAKRFDEAMPRTGRSLAEVAARIERDVIPDSNWLYHPRAMGHQVAAPLPAAIWSETVVAALNQSTAVFEMSPIGTTIERRVIRWMCDLAGYGPRASGTMTTGGTEATFTALLAARAAVLPDAWETGVGDDPPVLLCGEHAHYAVTRPAGELGLGVRNVITVDSDGFRMSAPALREALTKAVADKRRVLAVVATAGSTPTGSFDDLDAIASICEEFGVWLHVDAAHGGSALLSSVHRHRLNGLARARSIAWDPHKMMLLPLQAGVLLMRDASDLNRAYAQKAPYLFHGTEEELVNQGTRSFLCSHRVDAFKIWIALQRYGAAGIGQAYDHMCATTRAMHSAVVRNPTFVALHEPECNIFCFRWVGDRSLSEERLDEINRLGRERFNASGEGWITTTILGGRRVLRVTINNPRTTIGDVEAVLEGVSRVCLAVSQG